MGKRQITTELLHILKDNEPPEKKMVKIKKWVTALAEKYAELHPVPPKKPMPLGEPFQRQSGKDAWIKFDKDNDIPFEHLNKEVQRDMYYEDPVKYADKYDIIFPRERKTYPLSELITCHRCNTRWKYDTIICEKCGTELHRTAWRLIKEEVYNGN